MRAYALVDDADFEELSRWRWCLTSDGRHVRRGTRGPGRKYVYVSMHEQVTGVKHVDHEDGDGLNNQRSNLRQCPRRQRDNMQNRGANAGRQLPRGVAWHRAAGKWRARVKLDGVDHHLGLFSSLADADRVARAFRAQHMPFSEDARRAA